MNNTRHILSMGGWAILQAHTLELSASEEHGAQIVDIWSDGEFTQLIQTVDGSVKICVETC